MPGAQWFPGARLTYAEHVFRGRDDDALAIHHAGELRELAQWTWGELREQTARIARRPARAGRRARRPRRRLPAEHPRDDRRVPGARPRSARSGRARSPDFGARSVIDRFAQIEPKVLLAVDGYRYGGRDFDRREIVGRHRRARSARQVVRFGYLDAGGWPVRSSSPDDEPLTFEHVPFDHPLWVLYSLRHDRAAEGDRPQPGRDPARAPQEAAPAPRRAGGRPPLLVHHDRLDDVELPRRRAAHRRRRSCSTTATPARPTSACCGTSPRRTGMTTFGTSATYIASCMKAGVEPREGRDLVALRAVGSTGSPLSPEGFGWVYEHVGADTWLFSTSGGTDLCTAFVGGVPTLPVYEGELQARALGAKVEAWDEDGDALIGEVGELVLTEPMPSMPICFWGDDDGSRYARATSRSTRGSGATATGSRSPSAARRSSAAARTRRSTAAASAWARARSTARCWPSRTSPTRSSSTSRARGPTAGCRCSSCCATARRSTTTSSRASAAHPRGLLAAPRPERDPPDRRGPAHAVGQGARGAGQADPHGHPAEKAASRDSLANPEALD